MVIIVHTQIMNRYLENTVPPHIFHNEPDNYHHLFCQSPESESMNEMDMICITNIPINLIPIEIHESIGLL